MFHSWRPTGNMGNIGSTWQNSWNMCFELFQPLFYCFNIEYGNHAVLSLYQGGECKIVLSIALRTLLFSPQLYTIFLIMQMNAKGFYLHLCSISISILLFSCNILFNQISQKNCYYMSKRKLSKIEKMLSYNAHVYCINRTLLCFSDVIDTYSLLRWCQKILNTGKYHTINVTDLSSSWKSGLAFCALIHFFKHESMWVS